MESQKNKILDQLDKNKYKRENISNELDKLVGILELTEEKIKMRGTKVESDKIKKIDKSSDSYRDICAFLVF
ncbi:hypothetical protein BpHYR1_030617 [Brachionus plicatilis]|uniref:Uncharacterized protein n=1 Tax=Brachionus plicatilis TaxID=10195 RepID=A0A3M7PU71_BRAPC|nr:hypothetical protein BpHYR1_030617 [Brachionus plicatilis]